MEKCYLSIVALFFITLNCFAQSAEQLVTKSFENYKQAILTDNAESALSEVDSRTKKYYKELLEKVKTLDSAGVERLPVMDKFSLLVFRHKLPKEKILQMGDNDLFLYAIESGMVGKNSVSDNSIGTVIIEGEFAKGQLVSKGKAVPFYLHFYNEDKKWKFNITSLFMLANMSIKKLIEESGKSQNVFLTELIEMMTGIKPEARIWKPLL